MEKRVVFFLIFSLLIIQAFAQVDSVIYEPHNTEQKCNGRKCKYWVDNKQTSQAEYDKANAQKKNITNCKPCWLKYKDLTGQIIYEGDFYQDCCIGNYIERYNNGKLKVKGQYKPLPKDMPEKDIYNMGYCKRDGKWIYYTINGNIEKTVIYKDGEIIK